MSQDDTSPAGGATPPSVPPERPPGRIRQALGLAPKDPAAVKPKQSRRKKIPPPPGPAVATPRHKKIPPPPGPARPSRFRRRPKEGVVTIEYTPHLDGDPDPGEVVWAWIPFEEDPNQGKDRPVVVIGRRDDHLVAVPLTSRQNDREAQVSIGTGPWDSQHRVSYARIWRMIDLEDGAARREGAVLPRERFEAVVAAVDRHYDTRRRTPPNPDSRLPWRRDSSLGQGAAAH